MKEFKFLTNNKERESNIEFLLEYNRRLDYHYVCHYGIFTRYHQYAQASSDLFDRTNNFIRNGQLTNFVEVKRYVYLTYRAFTGEDYEISYMDASRVLDETYDFLLLRR